MDLSSMAPQPIAIRVREPEEVDPSLEAQAYAFAIGEVKENRATLTESMRKAERLGLNSEIVKQAYEEQNYPLDKKPSYWNSKEADEWLKFIR